MRFDIRQNMQTTWWYYLSMIAEMTLQDVFKHEVNSKLNHVDHFGASMVEDYVGMFSDTPMYEADCSPDCKNTL
jgi:hypothetical protein